MTSILNSVVETPDVNQLNEVEKPEIKDYKTSEFFTELEQAVHVALETYSNVHRGSGHYSMATTHLFDHAREIVLEYLGLNKHKYAVIFCTSRSAEALCSQLAAGSYQSLSSRDIGLALGVIALAVRKNALPGGAPLYTGGGTARLISKDWVVWAKAPGKFEAGTPAIINVIAFAKTLRMMQQSGNDIFLTTGSRMLTAAEILYQDELGKYSGRTLLAELRKTLIGRGVQVPTMQGIRTFINLDNSASTPTFAPIWDAFRQSLFQPEQVNQEIIQEVKSICAKTLGAPMAEYDLIFTSNTTETINLAAESLSREPNEGDNLLVLNTIAEHSSNDLPWRAIPGCSLIRLSVDAEGFVSLKELEMLLMAYNQEGRYGKKRIKLVAVSGASNVLGVYNNIAEISRIAHQYGARLLVDAAQLVAHHKVDMQGSGIDYLAFSGHKVYAPFGCGALVVRKELLNFTTPEMELIRFSGEENVGGIAALGKVLVLLNRIGMDLIREEEQTLTSRALHGMAQINGLEIYGVKSPESPGFTDKIGVIVFGLKNKMATQVGKELALYGGIGVRTGCHCAHIIIKHLLQVGPGLEKFQKMIVTLFPKLALPGLARLSFGIENTNDDVDTFIQVLDILANKPKLTTESATNGTPLLKKAEVQKQIGDFIRARAERVYS